MLLLFHSPFLFGYAKPVPVNFRALRYPRVGTILVAAAGPGMNLLLATIAARQMFPVSQSMMPTTELVEVMISRESGSKLMPSRTLSSGSTKSRPMSISKP